MNNVNQEIQHKKIAAQCFNEVWNYLDLAERTPDQNEMMLHLCHTSFWHWTQVPEHTATNLSIGYWQLSRVYSAAGKAPTGYEYGLRCFEVSKELEPFYLGYAYESLARSLIGMERLDEAKSYLAKAKDELSKVTSSENHSYLKNDVDQLEFMIVE